MRFNLVILTILNLAIGMLVAVLMMGGGFLNAFIDEGMQDKLFVFNHLFISYVLHPATGIVYISLFIGLDVIQQNIQSITQRYVLHLSLLLTSGAIISYVTYLAWQLNLYFQS